MASLPGPGNDGKPSDPGPVAGGEPLPTCPWWDPSCLSCPDGAGSQACKPDPGKPDICPMPGSKAEGAGSNG